MLPIDNGDDVGRVLHRDRESEKTGTEFETNGSYLVGDLIRYKITGTRPSRFPDPETLSSFIFFFQLSKRTKNKN